MAACWADGGIAGRIQCPMSISHASPLDEQVQRVRTDYIETPHLRLTPSQAQRRFGLEPSTWVAVLDVLLMANFLTRTGDGLFVRSATWNQSPPAVW
jgi:hypothetical protein